MNGLQLRDEICDAAGRAKREDSPVLVEHDGSRKPRELEERRHIVAFRHQEQYVFGNRGKQAPARVLRSIAVEHNALQGRPGETDEVAGNLSARVTFGGEEAEHRASSTQRHAVEDFAGAQIAGLEFRRFAFERQRVSGLGLRRIVEPELHHLASQDDDHECLKEDDDPEERVG